MYTGIDWGDLLIAGAIGQQNKQQRADAQKNADAIRENTAEMKKQTELWLQRAEDIRKSKSLYVVMHINDDLPAYNLLMNVEKTNVMKEENTVTLKDKFNTLVVVFRSEKDAADFAESVAPRARLPISLKDVDSITLNKTTLCSSYADKIIEQHKVQADYEHASTEAEARCYYKKDVTNYEYQKQTRRHDRDIAIACFIAASAISVIAIGLIFLMIFNAKNIAAWAATEFVVIILMLGAFIAGCYSIMSARTPIEPEYNNILDEEAFYKWKKANPGPSTLDYTAWKNDCDYYKHVFDNNKLPSLTEEPVCVRQSFSNVRKLPNE